MKNKMLESGRKERVVQRKKNGIWYSVRRSVVSFVSVGRVEKTGSLKKAAMTGAFALGAATVIHGGVANIYADDEVLVEDSKETVVVEEDTQETAVTETTINASSVVAAMDNSSMGTNDSSNQENKDETENSNKNETNTQVEGQNTNAVNNNLQNISVNSKKINVPVRKQALNTNNQIEQETITLNVSTFDEFINAFDEISRTSNKNYLIQINEDIYVKNFSNVGAEGEIFIGNGNAVTLYSEGHTLTLESIHPQFSIANGVLNFGYNDDRNAKYALTITREPIPSSDDLINSNFSFVYVLRNGILNMNEGTTLSNNWAGGVAGGVTIKDNGQFIMNGGIIDNCCGYMSGGVLVGDDDNDGEYSTFIMNGGIIQNCKHTVGADSGGGGVEVQNGSSFIMNGGIIQNCSAADYSFENFGGGVLIHGNSTFKMTGGEITNCTANFGAGLTAQDSTVIITGGKIDNNKAEVPNGAYLPSFGGGIFINRGTLTAENLVIEHNESMYGGGVYIQGGTADFTGSIIANNTASMAASDIYSRGGTVTLPNAKTMNQIYEADEKDEKIDGWYWDYSPRYTPIRDGKPEAIDEKTTDTLLLVASYKLGIPVKIYANGVEQRIVYDGKDHTAGFTYTYEVDGEATTELPDEIVIRSIQPNAAGAGDSTQATVTAVLANGSTVGEYTSNAVFVEDADSDYDIEVVVIKPAKLIVEKRNVTITSASAEKVYDGTPLTSTNVTISGDGFVEGEGANYVYTGSQTEVGSSPNTFSYVLIDDTDADNYNIEVVYGTLTVTKPVEKKDDNKKQEKKETKKEEKSVIQKTSSKQETKATSQATVASTSSDAGVQTGVEEQLGLYGLMATASAVGLTTLMKKKKEDE